MPENPINIGAPAYWVKVVDFLQQNWALIEERENEMRVWFVNDVSGVFDQIDFVDRSTAEKALERNGFRPFTRFYAKSAPFVAPQPPFWLDGHPNGKIYSSGRYWDEPAS